MAEENVNVEDDKTNVAPAPVEDKPEPVVADKPVKETKQTVDPDEFERTRAALAKANKEAADRRLKLKEWEELNVDPTTVKQLLDTQREAEIKKAEEEGRYQENVERIRKETGEQIERYKGEVETMKSKLERQIKAKEIASVIAQEDGVEMILEPHIANRVKLVELDDKYDLQVLADDGTPLLDDKGKPVPLNKFVAGLKEHPQLKYGFKAQKVSGPGITGTNTSTKSDGVPKGIKRSQMSDVESRDFVKKYGFDEYKKLPR